MDDESLPNNVIKRIGSIHCGERPGRVNAPGRPRHELERVLDMLVGQRLTRFGVTCVNSRATVARVYATRQPVRLVSWASRYLHRWPGRGERGTGLRGFV
jgi:hypothetical protein